MEFSFSGFGGLVQVDVARPGRLLVARTTQSDIGEQMVRQGCERLRARVPARPKTPPKRTGHIQQGWCLHNSAASCHSLGRAHGSSQLDAQRPKRCSREAFAKSQENDIDGPRSCQGAMAGIGGQSEGESGLSETD